MGKGRKAGSVETSGVQADKPEEIMPRRTTLCEQSPCKGLRPDLGLWDITA